MSRQIEGVRGHLAAQDWQVIPHGLANLNRDEWDTIQREGNVLLGAHTGQRHMLDMTKHRLASIRHIPTGQVVVVDRRRYKDETAALRAAEARLGLQ